MNKVKLKFMVVPEELEKMAYVEDPVKTCIIDCKRMSERGLLGDSGMKLAKAGAVFYFEKSLAEELIRLKIAQEKI